MNFSHDTFRLRPICQRGRGVHIGNNGGVSRWDQRDFR
jgi:hypothetical protein